MQASDIPAKFPIPFAANATSGFIRSIPLTTTDPNAASLTLGFPPNTFADTGAGGKAPNGEDMQGILNQVSAWNQWQAAGLFVPWDSSFSSSIGGYPNGAVVASATTSGLYWRSTVDNNTTNPDTGGSGWVSFLAYGGIGTGCQLQYASSSSLLLAPYNGGFLWINGTNYPIPANLNLLNAGLSASTLYYIYAAMSSGMILEASTTAYALNAMGIPLKIGDATRSLVGMAYHSSVSTFNDSVVLRNVASWFNSRNKPIQGANVVASTASGTLTELSAAARVEATVFSADAVNFSIIGSASNSAINQSNHVVVGIDGSAAGFGSPTSTSTIGIGYSIGDIYPVFLSDGHHIGSIFGQSQGSGGTMTASVEMVGMVRS